MSEYTEGQVVKGKQPPQECPNGFYWRKIMGQDAFRLYLKKERKAAEIRAVQDGEDEVRLTIKRVAQGVRNYMQHEAGFKQVMELANLSAKALQNLALWATNAAAAKTEVEKVKAAAMARANAALKDAGLMIGPGGAVQSIPAV